MIIALTGHRPTKLGREYNHDGPISTRLVIEMENIIRQYQPEKVISGMALGADTLWATAALITNTPFIAAVPFKGQEKAWPLKSQDHYHYLLHQAADVVIVCEGGYAAWKMQKRNIWMVDNCQLLVAVWNGTEGGTKNCVDYATTAGRRIQVIEIPRLV